MILLLVLVFGMSVEAKVKFGNWDKWDEQLPSYDNTSWNWLKIGDENSIYPIPWGPPSGDGVNNVILISNLFFDGKERISVIFYSSGNESIKDWDISKASLALVAFPPKKGKMTIRAYRIETEEQVFKFYEEWKIPFENEELVVPKEVEFNKIFTEFMVRQMERLNTTEELFSRVSKEQFSVQFLPHLKIFGKSYLILAPR